MSRADEPADEGRPAERLLGGYAGRLLLVTSLGWATIQAGRLVLSPMVPAVRSALDVGNAEIGLAFSVLWGVYALLQYPSGRYSDRVARTPLLVAGPVLAAAGFGLLAVAPTYPVFLLGAVVVATGAGLFPTAARALLSDLFVDRRGSAFGLHTASGDAGGVAAAVLGSVVLALTWRAAYPPVAVTLLFVGALVAVWSREAYDLRWVDLEVAETGRRLLADRQLRRLLVAYVLFAVTWQSATAFLPTVLREAKGLPPEVANAGFAALFVVGALVKPPSGWLGDALGRPRVASGAMFLGALALATVLASTWTPLVLAGVVVFAAGLMAFPPVMQAALMDAFPDGTMGGDLGGMRSVYIGLGAVGPTVVGAIADVAGFAPAFAGLVGCLVVSGVVIAVATR